MKKFLLLLLFGLSMIIDGATRVVVVEEFTATW